MKLAQLQEARYQGTHPIITKVEQIADDIASRKITDEYGFPVDNPETVEKALDEKYQRVEDAFGIIDGDYPTWAIRQLRQSIIEAVLLDAGDSISLGIDTHSPHLVVYISGA